MEANMFQIGSSSKQQCADVAAVQRDHQTGQSRGVGREVGVRKKIAYVVGISLKNATMGW
jgi:hypothetical protein